MYNFPCNAFPFPQYYSSSFSQVAHRLDFGFLAWRVCFFEASPVGVRVSRRLRVCLPPARSCRWPLFGVPSFLVLFVTVRA